MRKQVLTQGSCTQAFCARGFVCTKLLHPLPSRPCCLLLAFEHAPRTHVLHILNPESCASPKLQELKLEARETAYEGMQKASLHEEHVIDGQLASQHPSLAAAVTRKGSHGSDDTAEDTAEAGKSSEAEHHDAHLAFDALHDPVFEASMREANKSKESVPQKPRVTVRQELNSLEAGVQEQVCLAASSPKCMFCNFCTLCTFCTSRAGLELFCSS